SGSAGRLRYGSHRPPPWADLGGAPASTARAPGWSRWRGGRGGRARSASGSALRSRGRHGRLPRLPARLRSGLFATALLPRTPETDEQGLEARTAPGLIFLDVLARR